MRDGSEGENTISFSACRDFRGESTVHFAPKTADSQLSSFPRAPLELPPGLPVTVELAQGPVRGDQATAGDRIEGRLVNAISDPVRQTILLPAGAAMMGRLMRVQTLWGPPAEIIFALRWEAVEVNGAPLGIDLKPRRPGQEAGTRRDGLPRRGVEIVLPLPGEERYGVYHVSGQQGVLVTGFRSEWVTTRP